MLLVGLWLDNDHGGDVTEMVKFFNSYIDICHGQMYYNKTTEKLIVLLAVTLSL